MLELYTRIALYWLSGQAAVYGAGYVTWDKAAGTLTIDVNALPALLVGVVGPVLVYQWSRIAKRLGRDT